MTSRASASRLTSRASGTLVDARIILEAYGLSEEDVTAEYLKPQQAADRMRDGAMDAFFFVGGYPAGAIAELASQEDVVLVPVSGAEAEAIVAEYPFFAQDTVPGGTYEGIADDVATLSVGAQWITSADQPEELIYGITEALWNDSTPRAARRRPCQGQADHGRDRAGRHRHPAPSGRRALLPGGRHPGVSRP